MQEYTDQTGNTLKLREAPVRIVSTVPSQTELLCDLGLEKEVVGITAYCVHPGHWLKEKTVIGGTKDLQIERIKDLQPDLIIANKEENIKEQISQLAQDIPVYVSDIKSPQDALQMIADIGEICRRSHGAKALIKKIEKGLTTFDEASNLGTCSYFIWKDPWMVVSEDTFIQSMIALTGLKNAMPLAEARYPELKLEDLVKLKPDVILLSSEPYPFTTGDLHKIGLEFPGSLIKIVDGEMISWYGSRLIKSLEYLKKLREEVGLVVEGRVVSDK